MGLSHLNGAFASFLKFKSLITPPVFVLFFSIYSKASCLSSKIPKKQDSCLSLLLFFPLTEKY